MSIDAPNPTTRRKATHLAPTRGATARPKAIERKNQPIACGSASKPGIANSPSTFDPASITNGSPSAMSARTGYGRGRPAASHTTGMSRTNTG